MNWHYASVIPAKAGIHPLPPLDAGLRRHDESREKPCGAWNALQIHTLQTSGAHEHFVVKFWFLVFYLLNSFLVQPESSNFFMKLLSTITLASKRARSG